MPNQVTITPPRHATELQQLDRLRARLANVSYESAGMLAALVTSPKHGEHNSVSNVRVVPDIGVVGDRPYKQYWHGKRMVGRQISAINAETLDALEIDYAVTGDNLIISGIDLATLEKGDVIKVGDALLRATGTPHRPCKLFAKRTTTAHYAAISQGRLRGTMLNALNEATIYVGDSVERIYLEEIDK